MVGFEKLPEPEPPPLVIAKVSAQQTVWKEGSEVKWSEVFVTVNLMEMTVIRVMYRAE